MHSVCLSPPRLSLLLRNRTCDGTLHRNDVCFFHEQITYYRAQPPQLVLCKVVSIPKLRYPAIHVCVVCSHRLLRLLQFFIREKKTITGVRRRLSSWAQSRPLPVEQRDIRAARRHRHGVGRSRFGRVRLCERGGAIRSVVFVKINKITVFFTVNCVILPSSPTTRTERTALLHKPSSSYPKHFNVYS